MNRPASVTSAIVVQSLFIGIVGLSFITNRNHSTSILAYAVFFTIHALGLYGLIYRTSWARFYSIFIFSFWTLGIILLNILVTLRKMGAFQMIPGLLISGFMIWLTIALISSKDAKEYFKHHA